MATLKNRSKVNKKFILLICGFFVFAVFVLGGIYYWSYAAAPERNIRIGDECVIAAQAAEIAGNQEEAYKKYQEALSRYGRSLNKRQNNLAYSQKLIDTLDLMTPKTSSDAQELYQRRIAYMQKQTRAAPGDARVWIKLAKTLMERAQIFDSSNLWQEVVELCDDALLKIPQSDPSFVEIEGIRIESLLKEEEIFTADVRLETETAAVNYLKERPQDTKVWSGLLRSIESDIGRLATSSRISESQARALEFERVLAQAKAAVPANPLIGIEEVRYLIRQRQLKNPTVTPLAIRTAFNPLLWKNGDRESKDFQIETTLSGNVLSEIATIASAIQDTVALDRAIGALQNFVNTHPNAMMELNAIGKLQKSADQFDAALATFEQVLAMPKSKVSLIAAFSDELKASALEDMFSIEFGQWQMAQTLVLKAEAFKKAQAIRDRLIAVSVGRDGELAILRADARLAFARGDYLSAITKTEEIFARQKKVPADLFLLSAISLAERGEQGAALLKINSAIAEYPESAQFYLIRAGIEIKLGRLMDAKRSITKMLSIDPENIEAQTILTQLKKVSSDGTLNLGDPVVKILGDAELTATEGDVVNAVAQIQAALAQYPTDLRLQRTQIQWLLFLGNLPEAQQAVNQFLVANPNDPILRQLKILSAIPKALDRVKVFVNEPNPDGTVRSEGEKAVALALGLTSLRDSLKSRIASTSQENMPALTLEISEVASAAKEALVKAVELEPGDSSLIDRLYSESLNDKSTEQADKLVLQAEKYCKEKAIPILLRGRIALERNDFKAAIESFEQAVLIPGATAAAYRLLGLAREKSGDIEGAREAYSISYERRPNDIVTIQLYTALLLKSGKTTEARQVMRAAMLAMPESVAIRNAYFSMEAVYGNMAQSILERRRMYSVRPSDSENARQLMKLLLEVAPSRELILKSDGTEMYQPKEWDSMDRMRQEQALKSLAEINAAEAAELYAVLLKINPNDRATIRTYAASMLRAGRGIEGESILKEVAENATGENAWQFWIDLGEQQLQSNRIREAIISLTKAIELDQTPTSIASMQVSNLWSDRRQPVRALEVLDAAYLKKPTVTLARMIAGLRLETRNFAGARAMMSEIGKLTAAQAPSFSDRLLAADIANAELDESFLKLNETEYNRIDGEFQKLIEEAIRLEPANPLPFVVRASSFQRRFQRSGKVDSMIQAKSDIGRAIELQGNYWPATRLLASLQLDNGQIDESIQTVRRFIEQNPRLVEARRALVAYQLASGDSLSAIQTVKEILKLEPKNIIWLQLISEAHLSASLKLDAAKDNEDIFQISRNPDSLLQAILFRATNSPPDFEGILLALKMAPTLIQTVPFLQMIAAASIAGTAETESQRNQGIIQLREIYKAVEKSNGALTDPWILAVSALYPPKTSEKFEPFVLDACGNKPDSSLNRALAQQYIDVGPSGFPKARQYAIRALESAANEEDKLNALRVVAGVEYKQGNYAEAAKLFEQALAIRPDDLPIINNVAYLEAGNLKTVPQAIERARKAAAVNPINPDLMDTLGFALMRAGELPEAVHLLRRSARLQPTAMVYAHLAEALQLSGRSDEAKASLKIAVGLKPDAEAQEAIDKIIKSIRE